MKENLVVSSRGQITLPVALRKRITKAAVSSAE
jgi:bifunctional DNA-binding transcriptional regulator/antitoxin component of YhaV-PrlF toxin-antitoxin module